MNSLTVLKVDFIYDIINFSSEQESSSVELAEFVELLFVCFIILQREPINTFSRKNIIMFIGVYFQIFQYKLDIYKFQISINKIFILVKTFLKTMFSSTGTHTN